MEKYNHMIYVERKKGCNKNVFGRIFFFKHTDKGNIRADP